MKNQSEFKAFAVLQAVVGILFGYLGAALLAGYLGERYLHLPRWSSLVIVFAFFCLAMRRIYLFSKPESL